MRIPIDIPSGLNSDDTTFSASPAWVGGSNVRWRENKGEVIGGFESVILSNLTGVCRSILPWTDTAGILNLGFGTHSNFEVYQGGSLYDITPVLALPPVTLGTDPITPANGTPTIVVSQPGHPYLVGDVNIISGSAAVATVTINGTWTVTAVTTNTWTFTAGSNANASTAGGGSAVVVTPQRAFVAGQIDGTGSAGFGTGAYGVGSYGEPSITDYFPRTVALGAFGQTLLANPRGQTIYQWSNNTAAKAVALAGAPANVSYMLVTPNFTVMALGCSQEVGGVFNPMVIRESGVRSATSWSTDATSSSTAREYPLPGGGRLVGGQVIGAAVLAWTDSDLWLGTYVGQITQVRRWDRVGRKCGLIGPNAAVVVGSTAFWISPDRQFHSYTLGGAVASVPCPIRNDFADNLSASQGDKIVASSIAEFSEIRFDYPDSRDGHENSRYVALCIEGPDAGKWYRGLMARTAMVDAGPSSFPCGTTYAGNIYWHESGNSSDGAPFAWFLESADIYFDENFVMLVRSCWPDIAGQVGPINLDLSTKFFPQDSPTPLQTLTLATGENHVDFQLKGRLFKMKLSGNSSPTRARIGRMTFDAKKCGLR